VAGLTSLDGRALGTEVGVPGTLEAHVLGRPAERHDDQARTATRCGPHCAYRAIFTAVEQGLRV
jgi:hypothetical protein